MQRLKVSILGDGGWGTALCLILRKMGYSVCLWSAFAEHAELLKKNRVNAGYLPGFDIPKDVLITSDIREAVACAEALIIAIPSQFLRSALKGIRREDFSEGFRMVVSAVKGIENETFKRPSEIIGEELGLAEIAVLSGPTIARELAGGLPASAVAASGDREYAREAQELLMGEYFRIYTSTDIIGVELGGALKNIIAIAAGIADGLNLGTNAKAALFTRGLVEMKRLGTALGAREETFDGLSGMGDLMTTCVSPHSRNRSIGEEITKGRALPDIIDGMNMVAEGIETTRSVYKLAHEKGIDMPITDEIYRVLFEKKGALAAVNDLMARGKKPEF